MSLESSAHIAAWMPTKSWPLVACVGRFGSWLSSPPVRKLSLQAAASAHGAERLPRV